MPCPTNTEYWISDDYKLDLRLNMTRHERRSTQACVSEAKAIFRRCCPFWKSLGKGST